MSNIDNYKNGGSSNPYQKKENFTRKVVDFIKEYDNIIPYVIKEFDDIDKKAETKPCKAFDEKREGLQALKKLHDHDFFQNLLYWYVKEPENKDN